MAPALGSGRGSPPRERSRGGALFQRAAAGVLLVALSSCCCGSCESERKVTTTVNVPPRLEDLRRKYPSPAFKVSVVRRAASGRGPACGHSAACLVFLPLVLLELAVMDRWDDVEVTRGGKVVLSAIYDTDGVLRSAVKYGAGGHRAVVRLKLPTLGEDFVVERSRTQDLPDGGTVTTVVPIQQQVDLLGMYEAELKESSAGHVRGALLAEAYLALPGESDDFVLQRLAAGELTEEERRWAMQACWRVPDGDPRIEAFVKAGALSHPAPSAAFEALECKGMSKETVAALARAALPFYCSTDEELYLHLSIERLRESGATGLTQALPACPPERVALLKLALGEPVSDPEMVSTLVAEATQETVLRLLRRDDRDHRRWLIQALAEVDDDDLVSPLRGVDVPLDGAESVALLRVIRARAAKKESLPAAARLMDLFLLRGGDPAATAALRGVEGDLSDAAALALAATGDREARRVVAKKLVRGQKVRIFARFVSSEAELAAYALVAGGCDRKQLEENLGKNVALALAACPLSK